MQSCVHSIILRGPSAVLIALLGRAGDSMEDGVGSCQGQSRGGRRDKGERDGKECILK